MPSRTSTPLTRLARMLRLEPPRRGFTGAAQRVAIALLPEPPAAEPPAPPTAPPQALLAAPGSDAEAARERARRALIDARQAMGGMLGGASALPETAAGDGSSPVPPDLERLRAYLEEAERDRASLRAELSELRIALANTRRRVDDLERLLPLPAQAEQPEPRTPPAGGPSETEGSPAPHEMPPISGVPEIPSPAAASTVPTPVPVAPEIAIPTPAAVQAEAQPAPPAEDEAALRGLRERVLRALRDRVFAAGTVGTRVVLTPAPGSEELAAVADRLTAEPFVEHAEPTTGDDGGAIRLTLRTPLRWEQFSSMLERALERPLAPGDVSWSQGAVRVRLHGAAVADQSETPRAAPDAG